MSSDVTIRTAEGSDSARLRAIYRTAYRENRQLGFPAKAEHASTADVERWMTDSELYVAVTTGTVVGAARTEYTGDDRVKLSRLAVHQDCQGNGYASARLDHVEQTARATGLDAVWLTTPPDHPHLPAIYRGRGYEMTGDYPLDYRDYDDIVMEKPVDR